MLISLGAIPSIDTHASTSQRKRQHEKFEGTKSSSKRPRKDIKSSNAIVDLTTDTDCPAAQKPAVTSGVLSTETRASPPPPKPRPVVITSSGMVLIIYYTTFANCVSVSATTEMTGTPESVDTSTGNPAVTVVLQVAKDPGMASTSTTTPSESPSQSVQNSMDGPVEIHGDLSTMGSITQEAEEILPKVSVF